jgi:hypothetical protein
MATIGIREYKEAQTVLNTNELAQTLKTNDEGILQVSNLKVAIRAIDNTSGAVASMDLVFDPNQIDHIESYHVLYYAVFDPSHVTIEIMSYYPWNEGTLQLLKTIHVQRLN